MGTARYRAWLACGGVLLALWGASVPVHAQPATTAVQLKPGMEGLPLGRSLDILQDPGGTLTFEQVQAPERSRAFVTSTTDTPNFGFTRSAYWYRLSLSNPADADAAQSRWVLEMRYPVMDHLDYYITQQGVTRHIHAGDQNPNAAGLLQVNTIALPLEIAPGERVDIMARAQSPGSHQFPLHVWAQDDFRRHVESDNFTNGMYFGLMAVMILYNFIIFITVRDRAYLYYILYLTAAGYCMLILTGYARLFFNNAFSWAPLWINALAPVALCCVYIFSVLLLRAFLKTQQHLPRFHRWAGVSLWLALLVLCSNALFSLYVDVPVGYLMMGAQVLIGLGVGVYLMLKGVREARLYLLGWSAPLFAILFLTLRSFGMVYSDLSQWSALQIGMALEATILSLALASRINGERRERERMERLKQFFAPQVADAIITGGDKLLAAKRREVTVLFTDLRGFTKLAAESEPEDVIQVLREYHEAVVDATEVHHGNLEHFAGDGVMIFFNAPVELPDHPVAATRLALALRERFETLQERWKQRGLDLGVGMGLASGFATVGAVGARGQLAYSCIGSVTNLAARLCAQAKHGQILTSQQFVGRIEKLVHSEYLGEHELKGMPKPVSVCNLTGLHPA